MRLIALEYPSRQMVQRQRLAPVIFLKGFPCHSTQHIALASKARLPGVLVGEGGEDLGRDRILLILGERNYFFQRHFQ